MNKDDIIKANQPKQPLQPFHIFLEDGRTIPVEAATFEHEVNAEERIIFKDELGAPIKEIFCRAEPVALIVPDSRIARNHAFIELQTRVENLAKRLERVEEAQAFPDSPTGE